MEEVVAQSPLQIEDDSQAGEIARGILNRAVGRVVLGDIQLGQFDFRINDQRIRQIPNEHQVVVRVGDCKGKSICGSLLLHHRITSKYKLTTLNHHGTVLRVMRIRLELHGAAEDEC